MKRDMLEPQLSSFISLFLKPLPSSCFQLRTEIYTSLSSHISNETWYTWWHLTLNINPEGHSQNQLLQPQSLKLITASLHFFPCVFLVFKLYHSLYAFFLFFHYL